MSGLDDAALAHHLDETEMAFVRILKAKADECTARSKHAEAHGIRVARLYFIRHCLGMAIAVDNLPPTDFGSLDIEI